MARERGFDGNTTGFQIADFANHDDVGILPEKRLERRGEGHADVGAHQNLIDPEEVVLNGILSSHDIRVTGVDLGQRGVQRCRFSRARGSGDEHHAIRIGDRFHELAFGPWLDAEFFQVEREVALVENPQHHFLAEQRRQHAHAEVDDLLTNLELDAPVLRDTALSNIERRHDLEARNQRRAHFQWRLHDFSQGTVNAIADTQLSLETLEVDVGSSLVYRIHEDGINELDDRRFINLRRQHARILHLLLRIQHFHIFFFGRRDILQHRLHVDFVRFVVLLDRGLHRVLARQHRHDVVARDELEVINHRQCGWIGDRHRELPSLALERKDRVLECQLRGDQLEQPCIDGEPREVNRRHAELARQHADDVGFLHEPQLHHGQPESLSRRGRLLFKGHGQLLGVNHPLFKEEITEPFGGPT